MKTVFSLILLICSISASAQHRFTVELSGSKPFIPEVLKSDEIHWAGVAGFPSYGRFTLVESYKTRPGISLNVGLERQFLPRFEINMGLGFAIQNFKKEINDVQNRNEPFLSGYVRPEESIVIRPSNVGNNSILYLANPVKVQFAIIPNRLKTGIGITNYLVAFSSQIREFYKIQTQTLEEFDDTSSNGLNNYQLNGIISIEYRIFKSIWIQAGYNHGFLSIYDKQPQSEYPSLVYEEKPRYRTVEMGLKYGF